MVVIPLPPGTNIYNTSSCEIIIYKISDTSILMKIIFTPSSATVSPVIQFNTDLLATALKINNSDLLEVGAVIPLMIQGGTYSGNFINWYLQRRSAVNYQLNFIKQDNFDITKVYELLLFVPFTQHANS